MRAADTPIAVTFTADRWLTFLGYLSGVGCGEELEMWHEIRQQVQKGLE